MSWRVHTRATRPVAAAAAALVLALAAVLGSATAASAHDRLVGSDPAPDATLDALPAEITLTFNDAVLTDAGATVVEVTDAAGTRIDEGAPSVSGATVTQPVTGPPDANGAYSVVWKVVSGDGHPVSGAFSFTVADAPVPAPTPTVSETTASPSPSPSPSSAGQYPDMTVDPVATLLVVLLPVLLGVAVLVVAIVLIVRARRHRGGRFGRGDGPPGQD